MMDNKTREFVLREAERNAESVWIRAFGAGYERAREEFGKFRDGEATMEPPTKEKKSMDLTSLVGAPVAPNRSTGAGLD